jgi:hypothetical protein
MIHYETDADIERVALGLVDRTLPYAEWTHAAHFAAALWLLRHPDVLARQGGIDRIIRGYNQVVGVSNSDTSGYHATITLASLRGAASFLQPGVSLAASHAKLMASPLGQSRWLLCYWSEALLMSAAARCAWVEPDLAALPYPALGLSPGPEAAMTAPRARRVQ